MNTENTIVLPKSKATVRFIPFVTGGILLDISKQPDINKYLLETMIVEITEVPANEGDTGTPVKDVLDFVRKSHGMDFKAIDKKLQGMLLEAKDPEEAGK